jgi:NAD(P)-dependent dehydrogenase (short-subunit alcohol dehydrogenase family)
MGFTDDDCLIVTGAGSGIGRAIALGAASLRVPVAAWDLDAAAAERVVETIRAAGGDALAVEVDVADHGAVQRAMDDTGSWRHANLLVNNAGPPSSTPWAFTDGIAGVLGPVEGVTSQWLGHTGETAAAVVNIASIAGTVVGGGPAWYSAAKAGVIGYTRHLAAAAPEGLRVNAVAPGIVDTPRMTDYLSSEAGRRFVARTPRQQPVHPEEVAAAALFLVSPLASAITGTVLVVDAGVSVTV